MEAGFAAAGKPVPLDREETLPATAEEVVRAYADTVYSLALSQLRSRVEADDAFQEVFLAYMKRQPVFESREHQKAWFLRVTLNVCKKAWRYQKRHRTAPLEEAPALETQSELELFDTLGRLPEKYRVVLHLFYFEDLTTDTIARVLELSPNAVRTRLSRGREMLKKRLKDDFGR